MRPAGSLIDHAFVGGANLCVAHFASHADTFPLSARGLQPGSRTHHEYAAAIERLHQRLDPPSLAEAEDFLRPWSAVVTTPQHKVQHELQRLLDNTLWSALWQHPVTSYQPELRVAMRSGLGAGARAFASIIPRSPDPSNSRGRR